MTAKKTDPLALARAMKRGQPVAESSEAESVVSSALRAFQPLSIRELRDLDLPPLEYAVDGLLPLGSATLLSAREKAGKGLLTIDLCVSVAREEPFLDRAVMAGPTIYCAAEENIREVRARIEARVGDRSEPPVYVLRLDGSTDDRLDLADPELVAMLDRMIAEHAPHVVVLDTLREIHRGREDLSDDMAPLIKPLRQMAHLRNVALVVNHHMNKTGSSRGSTAIAAAFDQVVEMTREDEGTDQKPRATLRLSGRYGPSQRITVVLGEHLHWEPSDPRIAVLAESLHDRILTTLRSTADGLTARELTSALERAGSAVALKTVQNALAQLKQEPSARVVAVGRGTKSDPTRYLHPQPELIPPESGSLGARERGNHPGVNGHHASHDSGNDDGNNGNEWEEIEL